MILHRRNHHADLARQSQPAQAGFSQLRLRERPVRCEASEPDAPVPGEGCRKFFSVTTGTADMTPES